MNLDNNLRLRVKCVNAMLFIESFNIFPHNIEAHVPANKLNINFLINK